MSDKEIALKNKLLSTENFKISRFKEVIKRTKPHKHDGYLELIYLSEGAGFHWIDTDKYQITPPVMYVLTGQLHFWEMTEIPKGFVILIKEDFFDSIHDSNLIRLVRAMEGANEIVLNSPEEIGYLLIQIEKEYKSPGEYAKEVIQGYLQVVLAKLLTWEKHFHVTIGTNNSQFKKFLGIIRNSHPIINLKVQDVADQMNMSPQNLNSICQKASKRSASDLIAEQVILEAKRYLLHTDKNIAEIARSLRFTDPSHFVKYFKKHTGETPQTFREGHFQ